MSFKKYITVRGRWVSGNVVTKCYEKHTRFRCQITFVTHLLPHFCHQNFSVAFVLLFFVYVIFDI